MLPKLLVIVLHKNNKIAILLRIINCLMIDFTKEIKQKGLGAPNLISGALLPAVHYSMGSLQFAKEGLGALV
jgi:hypothetical protein